MKASIQRCFAAFLLLGVLTVRGQERLRLELDGVSRVWSDRSAQSPAFLRGLRTNRVAGGWQVDLVVSNAAASPMNAPWIVVLDASTNVSGIDRTVATGGLRVLGPFTGEPVAQVLRLTLIRGVPTLAARVLGAVAEPVRPAGRTLDLAGLPLEDVAVTEVGPADPATRRSGRLGWFSLETREGVRGWTFSKPGHLDAQGYLELLNATITRMAEQEHPEE
jgi:hypothetical protein